MLEIYLTSDLDNPARIALDTIRSTSDKDGQANFPGVFFAGLRGEWYSIVVSEVDSGTGATLLTPVVWRNFTRVRDCSESVQNSVVFADDRTECICGAGFFEDGTVCSPCAIGEYKVG